MVGDQVNGSFHLMEFVDIKIANITRVVGYVSARTLAKHPNGAPERELVGNRCVVPRRAHLDRDVSHS